MLLLNFTWIVFCIAYSDVNYFIVSLRESITSVEEERADSSAINYSYSGGFCSKGLSFFFVLRQKVKIKQ